MRARRLLIPIALVAFAFTASDKVQASGATTTTIPFTATFNPTLCSNLTPTSVTLTGLWHIMTHAIKNPDGTYTVKIDYQGQGTAVDNNGNTYQFSTENHEQDFTTSPADTPPYTNHISDFFKLIGKGKTQNLKIYWESTGLFDGTNYTVYSLTFKGDPSCDPI